MGEEKEEVTVGYPNESIAGILAGAVLGETINAIFLGYMFGLMGILGAVIGGSIGAIFEEKEK